MKKLPKVNTSKLLKAALPYILVGLMATKLGQAYRMASGGDVLDRIFGAFLKIGEAFANPLPSLHPFDLLVGDACGALLWFIVYQKSKNARKYRRGAEYGTARWGNAKDIEPFIDPDFSQNILLSETERLTLGKIADPEKRNVNLNVLVIGGSGSGKTRYHIKPNLLQMNASYVCSDPKGTVIEEVGRALVRGGYKIKVLNTIDFSCSMHYNPFVYLHSETDILTLVTVIMTNTQGEAKGGDGFWEKAEALLYQALIAYIYYEAPAEERNMNTLLDMQNVRNCFPNNIPPNYCIADKEYSHLHIFGEMEQTACKEQHRRHKDACKQMLLFSCHKLSSPFMKTPATRDGSRWMAFITP